MAELTQAKLKELLKYDPDTGVFTWLVNRTNGVKIGDVAGAIITGYRSICVLGKAYKSHRLAHLYMTGKHPVEYIDHVNGIKTDNRWCNLRPATNAQNQYNSGSRGSNCGFKNVTYVKNRKKYQVSLKVMGKNIWLGYFEKPEDAANAANLAREKYHGEFVRHF